MEKETLLRSLGDPCPSCPYKSGDTCDPEQVNQTLCDGSCNDVTVRCKFTKYATTNNLVNWMQWFNLFGFYWAMNFVTSYGEMVLAGIFAKWYWTRHKTEIPFQALLTSIFNVTVYHLGTIAFGSLIIAIIQVTFPMS